MGQIRYNGGMNILDEHVSAVKDTLGKIDEKEFYKAVYRLKQAKDSFTRVWIAGNGGSAATASHLANDLLKMCGIRAIALPELVPTITAFGNDDGWDEMFTSPLFELREKEDIFIAITCSGNSANVCGAAEMHKKLGGDVLVLTGDDESSRISQVESSAILRAYNSEITVQEDVHSILCHALAKELRG